MSQTKERSGTTHERDGSKDKEAAKHVGTTAVKTAAHAQEVADEADAFLAAIDEVLPIDEVLADSAPVDVDALMTDIDRVLEANALEVVANFKQKNGQ